MSSSVFDIKTFGAFGDGQTYDDLAFQRALDAIAALSPLGDSRGAILHIPFGRYRLRQTFHITRQMIIQGVSGGGNAGSILVFDPDVDGIVVHHALEGRGGDGSWTVIRDLRLISSHDPHLNLNEDDSLTATPDHTNHAILTGNGIVLHGRARIVNCDIDSFHFDGIHIETINFTTNANNWEVHNCHVVNNGRHGLYAAGENSNAGRVIGLDCSANGAWGVYDRSFLGNTYVGCHTASNGRRTNDMRALAIDPVTPTNFYAGMFDGGVFQSGNGGRSWAAINLGLFDLNVQALVVDRRTKPNPPQLYAGTPPNASVFAGGVFQNHIDPLTGQGVWRTTQPIEVQALAVVPGIPTTLYVGTAGGLFQYQLQFDSTPAVQQWTWRLLNTRLTSQNVLALAIDPVTSTTLYAGTQSGGVFKSLDGGVSWNPSNGSGATSLPTSGLFAAQITVLAIDPVTPTTLYAGAQADEESRSLSQGRGLFKSLDGGASWNPSNGSDNRLGNLNLQAIAIDPVTTSTLYVGTQSGGVFQSTDGGANWKAINTGLEVCNQPITNVQAIAIDPVTPTTLYVGTQSGGVFQSLNSGANWQAFNSGLAVNTQPVTNVQVLVLDPVTPTNLYAGTDAGVFQHQSGGSWQLINAGLPYAQPTIQALVVDSLTSSTAPPQLYAGTTTQRVVDFAGSLFQYHLNLRTGQREWSVIHPPLDVRALALDLPAKQDPPQFLFAGTTTGVFRFQFQFDTTFNEWHWSIANSGLNDQVVQALATDPQTPTTLYAGTQNGGCSRAPTVGQPGMRSIVV